MYLENTSTKANIFSHPGILFEPGPIIVDFLCIIRLNLAEPRAEAQNRGGNLYPRLSPIVSAAHLPHQFILKTIQPRQIFFHIHVFSFTPRPHHSLSFQC